MPQPVMLKKLRLEQSYQDLQDLLELIPKKDVLSIIGDWNAKVGSQETPGGTDKFGSGIQNEAGHRLIEFCQENTLVIANTLFQQHKRRLYTWTSPDGLRQNEVDYILCSQRWRSSIQSAKTRPGADCGSDHELLIAKFRLKLKKVGKTTRPFRYDLNQMSCTTAICKASSDNHFAFLHFFSMGMVLIPVSCTMSRTSIHSSSGYLEKCVFLEVTEYVHKFANQAKLEFESVMIFC